MRLPLASVVFVALTAPALANKICIDPGHGGEDSGGTGCNLEEEDIVLDVSLRLRTALQSNGFDVVMTRTDDAEVSLEARTDFANANGVDRFVSIHANAYGDASANGTETFCQTNSSSTSVNLRDGIQTEMIDAWGLTDRGGKEENFHVLRETSMPATLSELGFVTNCSVDALVLSDPARRQQAADAHLAAIGAHLGVAIDDPVVTNGTANGVVFEDQGVGEDNMDIRLAGATVLIVETGATLPAGADGAAWTLSLPPGQHTVRVSLPGYVTEERTCPVIAGDIAWCSTGLVPLAGEGEGEGEGEASGEGEGEPGEDEPESGVGMQRVTILPDGPTGTGGCSQSGSGGLLFGVALLGLLARRPRRFVSGAVVAMVAAVALPARAAEDGAAVVADAQVVARGKFASALLSPSGDRLLISDDHYAGLGIVEVKSGDVHMLTEVSRAGFRAVWVDDAHVAHRNPKRPFDGDPLVTLDFDGTFTGPFREHPTVRARQRATKDNTDVVEVNGAVISPADDRCFAPMVSAGGDVLFQCLRTGLYLHRTATGTNQALGRGTAPAFSGDGRSLVFLRTRDEGHVTLESDVVVVDLRKRVALLLPLPQTQALERAPSLSRDGALVSWMVDDAVVVARLRLPR